ncbi:molybdopterin-dependent oxidoreductase [Paracoccus spongiarum]|uniref:Molybdopterin-dependent oxidoreductase n=1 Tax=Paracoccus spongiarum TaxID=3064387 RepID=A0ABT9JB11_9RHOB|nr:molybdopterin-dependent oxidoreductase [Paracoccus sp. 2205BS29-5]MDP5306920.1 molybdopterin-dependent oxidoreductase [Paracoccus sp. 2205BS29-5]
MTGPIRSTCPYCGVGCGVLVRKTDTGVAVSGDPDHPANFGRLCSKGAALAETLGSEGRLSEPLIAGRRAGWDEALSLVARRLSDTIAAHGPDSVAIYGSGQMLTEDYYAANKFMKGFVGSANIDTNSRLCMASSVAGHVRAFGSDTVPGLYEDLELANLVVLVGSNLAWCHPVIHQRLAAARAARPGMRVVVIDPRRTATCDLADLHLPIAPGSDAAVWNAVLAAIDARGLAHWRDRLSGYAEAVEAARASDPAAAGVDLSGFIDLWCGAERVVTVYSQGINQSDSGTDKVNAITNCHLATGRIGRPGMGPFSITGQPNAMGGREVGGMANMLACHLDIANPRHRAAVQSFWNSPAIAAAPGLKAVDLFRAVEAGRVKALWVIGTNPTVSMPDADRVARAIATCDLVIASDIVETGVTRRADVVLPAAGWGERSGHVTNSERRISRQQGFLAPHGAAMPDWKIIAGVAQRMGFAGFDWPDADAVFAEYKTLSGIAGAQGGDFDISALTDEAPALWPQSPLRRGGRFFGDGVFHTPDGRGRMIAVIPQRQEVGMRLNTGRVRDHWHTMTRTGRAARLSAHIAEPFLEIHPEDAARIGLQPAMLAEVTSPGGRAVLRVLVTQRVAPGQPFAPIHWTDRNSAAGRVGALIAARVDPVSGQPALKEAGVVIRPYAAVWYGFAASVAPFRPDCDYWACATSDTGMRAELAGTAMVADWPAHARALFGLPDADLSLLSDPSRGTVRLALSLGGIVQAALFCAPSPVALSREAVVAMMGSRAPQILSGRAALDRPDPGATVCACLNVGVNTILGAIRQQGLCTTGQLGEALGAGSNCGSCRPELQALIDRVRAEPGTTPRITAAV